MSVQMAAFAFGCFLLMVGLVGGGFQVKELKVPKVGRVPRLTSCAFSLLFLFLGIRPHFIGGGPAPAAGQPPPVKVVERVVERPVLIPASAPAPQPALPAPQEAPASAGNAEKKRAAQPAAAPQTRKASWRQWLNRIKG